MSYSQPIANSNGEVVWELAKYTDLRLVSPVSVEHDVYLKIQRDAHLLIICQGSRVLQQIPLRRPGPVIRSRETSFFVCYSMHKNDIRFRFRTKRHGDNVEIYNMLSEYVTIASSKTDTTRLSPSYSSQFLPPYQDRKQHSFSQPFPTPPPFEPYSPRPSSPCMMSQPISFMDAHSPSSPYIRPQSPASSYPSSQPLSQFSQASSYDTSGGDSPCSSQGSSLSSLTGDDLFDFDYKRPFQNTAKKNLFESSTVNSLNSVPNGTQTSTPCSEVVQSVPVVKTMESGCQTDFTLEGLKDEEIVKFTLSLLEIPSFRNMVKTFEEVFKRQKEVLKAKMSQAEESTPTVTPESAGSILEKF